MHHLTADDLRRSRLHLFWVQVLLSGVVVAMLMWEITRPATASSELAERAPLGSFDYLTSGLQITVLVLLATVWIAPQLTLVWMVPVAWLLDAPKNARSGPRPSAGLVGVVVMVAAWALQITVLLV